jgi:hypothetical protein
MIDQCSCEGEHNWLILPDGRQRLLIGTFEKSCDACRGAANDTRDCIRAPYVARDELRRGIFDARRLVVCSQITARTEWRAGSHIQHNAA